uniref:Integrase catalytic domain-containing protein n=1 Tax=Fagus sylvatica TaxID=28930 RepID=A0A2N9ILM3_FAGSY
MHQTLLGLGRDTAPVIAASASIELWHSRLDHVSLPRIQTLVSRGLLGSVSSSPFDCMPCQLGKQPTLPFNNSESIASATFDLIHSDVWGPSPVPTTQYSKAIKVFRSDNAREYRQTDFSTILKHYGTIFHTSCAGTSQQNGRAERKLRHILNTVRALTNAASTPASFWGEAALTVVYTINRCPSPVIQNTTPYERCRWIARWRHLVSPISLSLLIAPGTVNEWELIRCGDRVRGRMKGNRGGEGIPHELLNLNLSLSLTPLQPLFKWVSADCVGLWLNGLNCGFDGVVDAKNGESIWLV